MAYNHPKGACWYNLENKIGLIAIPKNASSSLRHGLSLKTLKNYFELDEKIKSKLKLITVLREPISRFVSAYLEILVRANDSPKTKDKKFFQMPESIDRFTEFVSEIERDNYDAHVEHQHFYLYDHEDKALPFYRILNFSDLKNDFDQLKSDLNLKENLIHINEKSLNRKKFVYSYLQEDPTLLDRIKSIYKRDILIYNGIQKHLYNNSI